jgi:hypothetical protein
MGIRIETVLPVAEVVEQRDVGEVRPGGGSGGPLAAIPSSCSVADG